MKKNKIFKQILLLFAIIFGLVSCEDREIITIENDSAPIAIDLSSYSLFLDQNFTDNQALTVTWDVASYSVPVEINYEVQASIDEDFTTPYTMTTVGASANYASFNVEEMNAIAQGIGLVKDVAGTMYIRVVSFLGSSDSQSIMAYSNVTSLEVTPYELSYPEFYLVGDASYVGWNAGSAQVLYQSGSESVIYTYLQTQAFRFLGQQDWSPLNYSLDVSDIRESNRYFSSYTDNLAVFIKSDGTTDDENIGFTGDSGIYKIVIDSEGKTIAVTASAILDYDVSNLYLVGTTNGWDAASADAFTSLGDGSFEISVTLDDASEFKFLGQQDWGDLEWGNILADNAGNSGFLGPKGDDSNIVFDGGGNTYKITVNIKAGTYTIVQQ